MKLMKYLIISILVVLAYSCAEPMLLNPEETPRGIFVSYDPISSNINSEDIEGTPVTGTFDVPADNVASHDVYVKRIYDDGASESEYAFVETITEFPHDFSIDGNELAELFGVPVEETFANSYTFNCEATGFNGQVATFNDLEGELIAYPTQMQGFRFQAPKIPYSRKRNIYEFINKIIHLLPVQSDRKPNHHSLSDFKSGNRFLSLGKNGFLSGYSGQCVYRGLFVSLIV